MVSIYGPRDSKFDPIVREKEARIAALGAERDADLRAVYSKMVEKGEWSKFRRYAEYQYGLIPFLEPITEDEEANFDIDLEAWLFCLACPEQIPERMKLAAGWIRAKG